MKPADRLKQFTDSSNFIATIVSEAEKNNATASDLVRGLTEQQLNWKPDAKQWSIAQCLDHLAVTSKQFNGYFTQVIEGARLKWPTKGAVPYRPSLVGGWLIKQVVPETTGAFPAPKVFGRRTHHRFRMRWSNFLSSRKNSSASCARVKALITIERVCVHRSRR